VSEGKRQCMYSSFARRLARWLPELIKWWRYNLELV